MNPLSPRLWSALSQGVVMAVIWVWLQTAFALTPWSDRAFWPENLQTGLLFGVFMGIFEWFRWPRRRRADRS